MFRGPAHRLDLRMNIGVVFLFQLLSLGCLMVISSQPCPAPESGNLRCFVNYIDSMSCTWNSGSHPGDGPFLLILEDGDKNRSKHNLTKMPLEENTFHCRIYGEDIHHETLQYDIEVRDSNKNTLDTLMKFSPRCNIKMDRPVGLSYSVIGGIYHMTWMGYEEFEGAVPLQYELQFKKESSPWQEAKEKIITNADRHNMSVELYAAEFEKSSAYDLRVRCKTSDSDTYYWSQWSDWSAELRIGATGEGSQVSIGGIMLIVCSLVAVCVTLYLLLCSSLSARLKIQFLKEVPTAARFFEPLYIEHKGNFQSWTKNPTEFSQWKKDGISQEPGLNSPNVPLYQKEIISPLKLEAPDHAKGPPGTLEHDELNLWSCLISTQDIYVNEPLPYSSIELSMSSYEKEKMFLTEVCPTDYVSYEEAFVRDSPEVEH